MKESARKLTTISPSKMGSWRYGNFPNYPADYDTQSIDEEQKYEALIWKFGLRVSGCGSQTTMFKATIAHLRSATLLVTNSENDLIY